MLLQHWDRQSPGATTTCSGEVVVHCSRVIVEQWLVMVAAKEWNIPAQLDWGSWPRRTVPRSFVAKDTLCCTNHTVKWAPSTIRERMTI